MRLRMLETPGGRVRVAVTPPPGRQGGGVPVLVLAHGAGSDMDHPSLVGLAEAVAAAEIAVVRFDFPYRVAGRRIPDRMPALVASWGAVVDHAREALAPPWIAIGGRSMGGRAASHLVASGVPVRGLVFLSFPLHPAGRPGTERAAHLAGIDVPMLFVQGTRDALARWDLLEPLVRSLPRATLHAIADADHSLAVPKRRRAPGLVVAEIHATVVAWLRSLGG